MNVEEREDGTAAASTPGAKLLEADNALRDVKKTIAERDFGGLHNDKLRQKLDEVEKLRLRVHMLKEKFENQNDEEEEPVAVFMSDDGDVLWVHKGLHAQ